MIDKTEMRSHLENMERAASEVLQQDAAFFEALQALKWEIERDPRVRSAVTNLQVAGQRVFTSFVPQVRVRVRTRDGVFALPRASKNRANQGQGALIKLTRELTNAASAVILRSRIREQLDAIVNEAVSASNVFESIASEIEGKGHEVLICLDLSAYAQVHEASAKPSQQQLDLPVVEEAPPIELSSYDLEFMKTLKIKAD
jgi:uncharacterized membrane protein